jgi:hypothetical protein
MPLWLIIDRDRWGHSKNVVRADSEDAALGLVMGERRKARRVDRSKVSIELLASEGEPAILWCEDDCPDTPR